MDTLLIKMILMDLKVSIVIIIMGSNFRRNSPYFMSGTVIELSAMFVAKMTCKNKTYTQHK